MTLYAYLNILAGREFVTRLSAPHKKRAGNQPTELSRMDNGQIIPLAKPFAPFNKVGKHVPNVAQAPKSRGEVPHQDRMFDKTDPQHAANGVRSEWRVLHSPDLQRSGC